MTKWMIWFEDNKPTVGLYKQEETLVFVGDFPLDEISNQTGGEPLIGVFSTEHVSFVETTLPKTSEKKLRLALPSLVEESIASNPEDNFYALPLSCQTGSPCTVAVISLKYLENLIAQAQGLSLQALIPDCYLLKTPTEGMHKFSKDDRVVVRTGPQGFSMHKQHAVLIMQELDSVPESEPSLNEPAPFNFLQAQFSVKPPKKTFSKQSIVYYALGGAVAVHLIGLVIMGSVLNQRLETLKDKSLELYAQVFPGAVKVSSAKSLIERELKNAGSRSQDPVMGLLARASEALSSIPGAKLEKLEYNQKGLTLHLVLPNMAALEQLSDFKQEKVVEQDNTVLVDLLITPGESS